MPKVEKGRGPKAEGGSDGVGAEDVSADADDDADDADDAKKCVQRMKLKIFRDGVSVEKRYGKKKRKN